MSDENSQSVGLQSSGLSKEQLSALVTDKELRQFAPGSPEYQAAFDKKFGPKSEESASSPETKPEVTKSETKTAESEPSDKTDDDLREHVSKKTWNRISGLREDVNARDTEIARLKAELEAARNQKPVQKTEQRTEQKTSPDGFNTPKPKLDEFKNFSDYQEALTDWKIEKRDFDKSQVEAQRANQDKARTAFEKFRAMGADLEKADGLPEKSFDTEVSNEKFRLHPATWQELYESEHGARIALELAKGDDLDGLANLSPSQQVKLIGKLEAKYESQKKQKQESKTVSSAKPPAGNLPKGSSGSKGTSDFTPGMSVREFEAQRLADRQAKGKSIMRNGKSPRR